VREARSSQPRFRWTSPQGQCKGMHAYIPWCIQAQGVYSSEGFGIKVCMAAPVRVWRCAACGAGVTSGMGLNRGGVGGWIEDRWCKPSRAQ